MQTVQPPINLENWIEENREKFKPPVSNCYLYDGRDFFVMVIKGPNARNDFHLVDSEEYFYQLKGDI
ncbi:MAG: 3-hydroxyanthranilate 3,4-dioxygenase, partial [Verrucomicrobia bacterium]